MYLIKKLNFQKFKKFLFYWLILEKKIRINKYCTFLSYKLFHKNVFVKNELFSYFFFLKKYKNKLFLTNQWFKNIYFLEFVNNKRNLNFSKKIFSSFFFESFFFQFFESKDFLFFNNYLLPKILLVWKPWKKKPLKFQLIHEEFFLFKQKKKISLITFRTQIWLQIWFQEQTLKDIFFFLDFSIHFNLLNVQFNFFFQKFFFCFVVYKSNICYYDFFKNRWLIFFRKNFFLGERIKISFWKKSYFYEISFSIFKNYQQISSWIYDEVFQINDFMISKNKYFYLTKLVVFKKFNSVFKKLIDLTRQISYFFNFSNQNFTSQLGNTTENILFNSIELNYNSQFLQNKGYFYLKQKKEYSDKKEDFFKIIQIQQKWHKTFYNNRKFLNFFFFLKKKKQYFLTRFFSKFLKKSVYFFYLFVELNLITILQRSKLIFTYQQGKDLLFFGSIYINNVQIKNPFFLIKKNDLIQLKFDLFYLKNYMYVFSVNLYKEKQIKYCFYRWFAHRYDFYKQHTNRFPKWILRFFFYKNDIPLFLEVDFFTLTSILLNFPIYFYDINFFTAKYINVFFKRLYNWKFLT